MNLVALLATLVVGLFVFIGSIIGIYFKNNKTFIETTIGMAFSIIIAISVIEILPESFELLNEELGSLSAVIGVFLLVSFGIVILKIVDLFVPNHDHENTHNHKHINNNCRNMHLSHIGYMTAITLIIHNIIEGISFYIAASNSNALTMGVGIALHNIPLGLVIVSTLNHKSYSKKKTLVISLIVSLSTFVGALLVFFTNIESILWSAIMVSITLGMLIYIALFELLEQIRVMKDKTSARNGIVLGILILLIGSFFH